jgi:hypothetical protein
VETNKFSEIPFPTSCSRVSVAALLFASPLCSVAWSTEAFPNLPFMQTVATTQFRWSLALKRNGHLISLTFWQFASIADASSTLGCCTGTYTQRCSWAFPA